MSDRRILGLETSTKSVIRTRPTIEGRPWRLVWSWSSRAQLWMLAISDATGLLTASSISVVVGTDLLAGLRSTARPPGQLWVQDTSGRRREAGRSDLGRSHRVLYRPSSVVAELVLAAALEGDVEGDVGRRVLL